MEDDVDGKIQAVYAEIEKKSKEAEMLSQYLKQQQIQVILDEEKEEEDLKRQGIIVGQHIPSLPSRLNLDNSLIADYENFASTVLVAKELMVQNRTNFLRRTGNLPISDLAETRKEANLKYMSELTSEVPHYLLATQSADIRKDKNHVRFEEAIQSTKKMKSTKVKASQSAEEMQGRQTAMPISAKEKMEHEKVLQSLNHKLNYLRNPRNDPTSITKMLLKPKSYYLAKQNEVKDDASAMSKFSKQSKVNDNPLFLCEPSAVLFMDFEIGQKYTRTLFFRNTSAVTRSLRVIPPKSPLFSISPLRYPNNSVGGMVAPGMSVSTVLSFVPKELGDFEDSVIVQSESGTSTVRVVAQREPPKLSIPSVIRLPDCLVGDAQRFSISCVNNGGKGNFVLFSEDLDWKIVEESYPSLRISPFTIYPSTFTLGKDDSTTIVIEFVPLSLGLQERKFSIHCDNGQVREFTVQAMSKQVNVAVGEVNHVLVDFNNKAIFQDIIFPSVTIGSSQSQQVVLLNDTGLSIEYEWVFLDESIDPKNINAASQAMVRNRERSILDASGNDHGGFHPDDSLLRSIRKSLDDQQDNLHPADGENRARFGSLEILPARGVIAGEGAAEFTFNYHPTSLQSQNALAVFVVKSIPRAALPNEDQQLYLSKLQQEGHGRFMRLLSWIDDLATPATVSEYKRRSGVVSTSLPLIGLSKVVELVRSQIVVNDSTDAGWTDELVRFHKIVHQLLRHTYDARRNVGISADDSSVVEEDSAHLSDNQRNRPIMVEFFDWDGYAESIPKPIFPFPIPEGDISQVHNDDDDDEEVDTPADEGQDPLAAAMSYSDPELSMMAEVWLSSENATKLVGDALCSVLNDRVMHEAVDYLKDSALNHLAALNLRVVANSNIPMITVHPPLFDAGSSAAFIGQPHTIEVAFTNHSIAPVQLRVLRDSFVAKRLYSSQADDIADDKLNESIDSADIVKAYFHLASEFEYVLVMPKSREIFRFNVQCSALGRFELVIPVESVDRCAHVEPIKLRIGTAGPKLCFEVAEIDLGLLGVGQEESRTLTFSNRGSVPAMFIMKPQLYVETSITNKKGGGGAIKDGVSGVTVVTSRPSTHREQPMSARSTASRGSVRSEDFSVADSAATSTDFKIELKNAMVAIEPSSGVIPPNSTMSIQIIGKAGKLPQRIRGMIETRVFDEAGLVEVHRQFLNLRGEVQAPKVLLYPMHQNFGQVYVGRPIHFTFTLENICNLPTKFKFLRPGGQSAMFSFNLIPTKGSLEAKQKLVVEGSFVALAPGVIDDVLACKLFGISLPLGFSLKALAKGIQLDFVNLKPHDPVPPPIAEPHAVQFPGGERPPEPGIIQPIMLGDAVPLYERRAARFVIRNLSAIAAPFEIKPRRFVVVNNRGKKGGSVSEQPSTSSVSTRAAARNDLILAPHEEGRNRFESEAGKKYIGTMVERREDKTFLKSGLGAAYAFSVAEGVVPPWGVQEVVVDAFNDIPGCYDDDIEISVHESEIVRKFHLPIRLSVVGCPVVIEKHTVGMTYASSHGPVETRGESLLRLGQGAEFGPPLSREFFLRNHGSKAASIKWTVRGLASKMNGPIKFSLSLRDKNKVKCSLRFWDDLAKESPFTIQPSFCEIAPYGRAKFVVTLARSSPATLERAQLTAKVSVRGDDEHGADPDPDPAHHQSSEQLLRSHNPGQAKRPSQQFALQMTVEGEFIPPQLTIEKRTFKLPTSLTEIPQQDGLVMKAKATVLFSSDGKLGQPCSKFISISNPLEMPQLMTLSTEGALVLKDVQGGCDSATAMATTIHDGSVASKISLSSNGQTVSLGPYQSTKFMLTFQPRKQVRQQLLSTFGTEAGKPTDQISYLVATFPTGQTLRVPVTTSISTPFISGSSPRLNFGTCHTKLSCDALFLLRNPTDVPARWSVTHVAGGGQWRQSTAIRVKGFEQDTVDIDDPSVFEISPNAGVIEGPTVSTTAAMAAPPKDLNRLSESVVPERLMQASWAHQTLTLGDSLELRHSSTATESGSMICFPLPITIRFSPKRNVSYCSRFRFHGEFANSFDLVLQGVGTFEEHEHKPLNPVPR